METPKSILAINAVSWIGGAEGALVDMLSAFDPKRFISTVVCPEEGHLPAALRSAGLPVEILPFYGLKARNPLRYFETIYRLTALVREHKASLIHINHQYFANYGVALGKACRKPMVVHLRGVESDAFFGRYAGHIARANAIICVSDAARARLLDYASQHIPYMQVEALSKRAVTVYDGFRPTPCSLDHARLRKRFGIAPDARIVGTVGQVTPEKGLKQFVEAAQVILEAAPRVHFLVVGTDPHPTRRFDEQLKSEIGQLGLGKSFTFTGFLPDAASLLSGMDVSVLASHQDAFPRVVLESLSAGALMVATRVGGVPEIVEDGISGLLVPPGDSMKLAAAILCALEMPNDQRRQMIGAGRQSVARFSVERHAEQVQRIYTRVLSGERCMND